MEGLIKKGLVGGHTLDYSFKGNYKWDFPNKYYDLQLYGFSKTLPHFIKSVKKQFTELEVLLTVL